MGTIINVARRKNVERCCLNCSKITARNGYTYCSNYCQREYEYKAYITKWKAGKLGGLQKLGIVSKHIKRYLRDKYHNKCSICGWSETNFTTGEVPLVADHVDGNWQNNIEQNLRLICPNCDSLSPTYAGLNRGHGRPNRAISKRHQSSK